MIQITREIPITRRNLRRDLNMKVFLDERKQKWNLKMIN